MVVARKIAVYGALAILVSLGAFATPVPADLADDPPVGCTPHPTIRIEQNEGPLGFVVGWDSFTGEPIYRPGSGVTDGTGTAQDPFVIEGWCLRSSTVANPVLSGMFIANTDAHLVIRGNVVDSAVQGSYGMYLWGVANVRVEENTIGSQDTAGVRLRTATDSLVANNTIRFNSWYGVQVGQGSTGIRVQDNHVTYNALYGVYILNAAHGNTVRNNHFELNQIAVRFFNGHNNLIEDNVMTKNHWGVFNSVVSSGNVVRGNNIDGSHEHGVENNVNTDVDARGNWWGCPYGPGGAGCDTATGRVLQDPWLSAPNPDAGPR